MRKFTTIIIALLYTAIILLATGLHFSAFPQIKKASLQAAGLTYAMCSRVTQQALKALPFADKADTDLNNTTFLLSFKPDVPVNIDQIKQSVDDAGFCLSIIFLML